MCMHNKVSLRYFSQLQNVIDQKCLFELIIHNLKESMVIFKDGKINHVNE